MLEATSAEPMVQLFVASIAERLVAQVAAEFAKHLKSRPRIQPALLTVKDAAEYLGRTEQSLQHLIHGKELPVVRAGRRVHLDRKDLDDWIEKNKC